MWAYIEYTLGLILSSQRGRDAKLFHKSPAFSHLSHPSLEVTSPECGPSNSELSSHHGNEGGSQFPVLSWRPSESDVFAIADVKEYLLIVEDPDAPLPNPIVHGVYYAIPADTRSVDALSFDMAAEHNSNNLKGGFKFGQNRMGNVYGGPKPVLGHGPHRYFYQVVALSERLDPDSFATKLPTIEELAKAVEGKVLAWGVWVGVFERKMWTSQNTFTGVKSFEDQSDPKNIVDIAGLKGLRHVAEVSSIDAIAGILVRVTRQLRVLCEQLKTRPIGDGGGGVDTVLRGLRICFLSVCNVESR